MLLLPRKIFPLFVLAVALGTYGCSSSKPAGEGSGNPDATPDSSTTQSNADQVGSVPEDMLADEKGVEGSGTSPNPEASSSDPFGDLKQKEEPKQEATAVEDSSDKDLNALTQASGAESGSSGSSAGSGKMDTYTVKPGDTLMKIAFQIYGDVDRWHDLHELNAAKLKGGALRKGLKLKYEVPMDAFQPEQLSHSYLIKKGDTLAGIADDVYGKKMKYKKLQAYNKKLIKNPNRIFAGFTIFYDITDKEMAEAEARRAQKAAGGGGAPAPAPAQPAPPPPSALTPPPAPKAPNVASDNSAVPGPGAQQGPPAPTAQ
jgi:LysM repeat protein